MGGSDCLCNGRNTHIIIMMMIKKAARRAIFLSLAYRHDIKSNMVNIKSYLSGVPTMSVL